MRTGKGEFELEEGTKKRLGGVNPAFGLSRFGNPGATSRSGHERNRLFLSRFPEQREFTNVSGISGADSPADGRAVAFLDFDHDGWLDMAVVNANAPLTQLFHNQLGSSKLVARQAAHSIAVRFVGGNDTARASAEWSSRDGFGTQITVEADGRRLLRTHRAGEGLAAQNSATLLVGIGSADKATALEVRWPSGRTQELSDIPAGMLVTVFEDAARSPGGTGFELTLYREADPRAASNAHVAGAPAQTLQLASLEGQESKASLRMFVTMATWCSSCLAELPELEHLRGAFEDGELQMFGVPADEKDTPEMLEQYAATHQPAYKLLSSLDRDEAELVKGRILETLGEDALPATIVTDADGQILMTRFGAPSVSELRRLLAH